MGVREVLTSVLVVGASVLAAAQGAPPLAVKGTIAPGAKPAWEKGIAAINSESYYNAIECGKQGGNPACVFWDTGLCKNPDFEIAMYTPYKSVAYEVWRVVSSGKPAPQPNYAEAQHPHHGRCDTRARLEERAHRVCTEARRQARHAHRA